MTLNTAIILTQAFAKDHLKNDYDYKWERFIDNLTGDALRCVKTNGGFAAFIKQWDGYNGVNKKVVNEFYKAARIVVEGADKIEFDW